MSPTVTVSTAGEQASTDYAATVVRPTGVGFVRYEDLVGSTPYARVNAAPQGSQVTFPEGVVEFSDFTMFPASDASRVGGYGIGLLNGAKVAGARGSGIDKTIWQMRARSSSRAGVVPPDAPAGTTNYLSAGTNNLWYTRLGNNNGPVTLTDLTIRGTDQGHNYNGLVIYQADRSLVQDVKITGNRGSAGANPGETFTLSVWKSTGVTLRRLILDGQGVSSSLLAGNNANDLLVEDCTMLGNRYGAGVALFQCANPTLRGITATANGDTWSTAINFERTAGTLTLDRPNLTRGTGKCHMMLESDTTSATVTINDPTFDGPQFLLRAGGTYQGNANKQDVSKIKLYVGGVERPDLLRILP